MRELFFTGKYRNLFKKCGYSEEEIENRVKDSWQQLFYGEDRIREKGCFKIEGDL